MAVFRFNLKEKNIGIYGDCMLGQVWHFADKYKIQSQV